MKDREFAVEVNDVAKDELKNCKMYAKGLQIKSNNKLGNLVDKIKNTNDQLLIDLSIDPIGTGIASHPELLTGDANLVNYFCERDGLNIYYDVFEVEKNVVVYGYEWRLLPSISDFFDEIP